MSVPLFAWEHFTQLNPIRQTLRILPYSALEYAKNALKSVKKKLMSICRNAPGSAVVVLKTSLSLPSLHYPDSMKPKNFNYKGLN